jgi:hypothetical protein
MATQIRDANGIALTQQEAEAIIDLWAKKQAETETLRSRLTVEDMAEAMSVPPREVEQMLAAVRLQKLAPPEPVVVPVKRVRPVNSLLIALASAVWIVILIGACYAAYQAGRDSNRFPPPPVLLETPLPPSGVVLDSRPAIASDTIAPPAVEQSAGFEFRELGPMFSANLSLTFDGVTIQGLRDPNQHVPLSSMSLERTVAAINTIPLVNIDSSLTDIQVVRLLRSAKNPADGSFEFKVLKLESGGKTVSEMIPVALSQNQRISRLVADEQARRLKILANKAGQQLDL